LIVLKKILMLVCLTAVATTLLRAQEIPTMVRAGELQVGGGYAGGDGDYSAQRYFGPYFYASFDFRDHIGIQAEFRQVNAHADAGQNLYERTYEIGPRYVWHFGRVNPYFKLLAGRGVFNFPHNEANLAYDMWSAGGGVDVRATRYLNVRVVDFETQQWVTFSPNNLAPNIISAGVAYRFH
jgi:hypothetical protein